MLEPDKTLLGIFRLDTKFARVRTKIQNGKTVMLLLCELSVGSQMHTSKSIQRTCGGQQKHCTDRC